MSLRGIAHDLLEEIHRTGSIVHKLTWQATIYSVLMCRNFHFILRVAFLLKVWEETLIFKTVFFLNTNSKAP